MRRLQFKTNVIPPDSDYPFGRAKDNPGNRTGTPVDEDLLGDILQFFEKLFSESQMVANEMPDNDYSGFQLFDALMVMRDKVFMPMAQLLGGYLPDTEGLILTGCEVTGAGPYDISSGVVFLDGEFLIFPAYVGQALPKYIVPDTVNGYRPYAAKLDAAPPGAGQYIEITED